MFLNQVDFLKVRMLQIIHFVISSLSNRIFLTKKCFGKAQNEGWFEGVAKRRNEESGNDISRARIKLQNATGNFLAFYGQT